jgi:hypothetical protein
MGCDLCRGLADLAATVYGQNANACGQAARAPEDENRPLHGEYPPKMVYNFLSTPYSSRFK